MSFLQRLNPVTSSLSALPGDLAALLYALLDFVSQCVFGVVLLRKVPSLADWGDELQKPDADNRSRAMAVQNGGAQVRNRPKTRAKTSWTAQLGSY